MAAKVWLGGRTICEESGACLMVVILHRLVERLTGSEANNLATIFIWGRMRHSNCAWAQRIGKVFCSAPTGRDRTAVFGV
jgi:hypothetical protein